MPSFKGSESSSEKAVRVCVALRKDCSLDIQVKDVGPGFDPARLLNPLKGEDLVRGSGRGIFLIRQLMDNVQFKVEDGTERIIRVERFRAPVNRVTRASKVWEDWDCLLRIVELRFKESLPKKSFPLSSMWKR